MRGCRSARLGAAASAAAVAVGPLLPAGAAVESVAVGNFYYEDETVGDGRIVIDAGDQIRFVVQDGGPGTPHTVEIDFFGVHSGGIASGETYTTKQLNTPGSYRLYCKPHQNRGHETTLVIRGASKPTPAATTAAPKPSSPGPRSSSGSRPTGPTTSTATSARTSAPAGSTGSAAPGTSAGASQPPGASSPAASASPGDAVVAEGRGTASADELDAGDLGQSDLERALGRNLTSSAPWTRGVRLALLALLPMVLLGAWAVSRWTPGDDA